MLSELVRTDVAHLDDYTLLGNLVLIVHVTRSNVHGLLRWTMKELLDHPDWGVRQGAVLALGELGTKEADEALRLRQTRETHPAVQRALRKALRQPETDRR